MLVPQMVSSKPPVPNAIEKNTKMQPLHPSLHMLERVERVVESGLLNRTESTQQKLDEKIEVAKSTRGVRK